jgi:hypothetical protein
VGNIDRAFKSRIHVALYYPKLDKLSTYEIWKRNIKRIKADFKREKKDFSIEEKDILRYSKEHFNKLKADKFLNWNGRQIRNAFQTAIALAEYDARPGEKPVLSRKQFETVATASRDFDQYLKDTQRGKDDAQLAQEERSRNDAFGEYGQNSGFIEEGIQWTPPRTIRPSNPSIPPPIQRRNSAGAGKKKAIQEEVIDEELTDDTVSVTDDDEVGSEAEASMDAGHSEDDAEGSSSKEEEVEEPTPPPKPTKTKAKSKSSDKPKASSSKDAENAKADGEDDETESKPKKKTKGSSSKSRQT